MTYYYRHAFNAREGRVPCEPIPGLRVVKGSRLIPFGLDGMVAVCIADPATARRMRRAKAG